MERFGRRNPLIIGGIWCSAWLFVYGAAGTARDPLTDQGIGKRESLFDLLTSMISTSLTYTPLTSLISDLFDLDLEERTLKSFFISRQS